MTKLIASLLGAIWDIIIDGDDTLWECALYYNAAARVCFHLIQYEFPAVSEEDLRHRCRSIQRGLIDKKGYYAQLYEDAWVETYLQLCHRERRPVCETMAGAVFIAAASVHDARYSLFRGVPEALAALQAQGHRLHLLTLGDNDWQLAKVRRNGLEGFFTSTHVIQRTKGPQMRLLAQDRDRTVMVGDSPRSDMLPAARLGLWRAQIHSTDGWVQTHHRLDGDRHFEIEHFADFPDTLRRIIEQSRR